MNGLFFWSKWKGVIKLFYVLLLSIFFISLGFMIYQTVSSGTEEVLMNEMSVIDNVSMTMDTFEKDQLSNNIEAQNYVISQYFDPGEIKLNFGISIVFGIVFILCISLLLAVGSGLQNLFGYILLACLSLSFLFFIQIGSLGLFGLPGIIVSITFALVYLFPYILFRFLFKQAEIATRAVIFMLISGVLISVIYYYSETPMPLHALGHFNFWLPIVFSGLFLILISHEVLSSFLLLISGISTSRRPNNYLKYLIVVFLYLGNLTCFVLYYLNFISFKLVVYNPILLFTISAILGIWGVKERNVMANRVFPFEKGTAFIYLLLGIITFSFIGFGYASHNYAFQKLFVDFTFFAHLSFGIGFFVYTSQNFIELLIKNVNISGLIYKPNGMAYWIVFVSGLILTLAIVGRDNAQKHLSNLNAGKAYHYALGHLKNDNDTSTYYFQKNFNLNSGNPISSYILTNLAISKKKFEEADNNMRLTTTLKPRAYTYIQRANLQNSQEEKLKALFTLQEGVKDFPNSFELNHNLAYQFEQLGILDSCAHYYRMALALNPENPVTLTNINALSIKSGQKLESENIEWNKHASHVPYQNNLTVINNLHRIKDDFKTSIPVYNDSILETTELSYIHNLLTGNTNNPNRSYIEALKFETQKFPNNPSIKYALAIGFYYTNQIKEFKETIDEIIANSDVPLQIYYSHLAGRLFSKKRLHYLAADYYNQSKESQLAYEINDASLSLLFSKAHTSTQVDHLSLLKAISIKDTNNRLLSSKIMEIMTCGEQQCLKNANDSEKVLASLFLSLDSKDQIDLVNMIESPHAKTRAILNYLERALHEKDFEQMNDLLAILPTDVDKEYQKGITFYQLRLLVETGEIERVSEALKSNSTKTWHRNYLNALVQSKLENPQGLDQFITLALAENPFHPETVDLAFEYYYRTLSKEEKAYNIVHYAVSENPNSIPLNKVYIGVCIDLGYFRFTKSATEDLQLLMTEEDFEAYYPQVAPFIGLIEE